MPDSFDNFFSLVGATQNTDPDSSSHRDGQRGPDWAASLGMILQAAEAMQASEVRAEQIEAQARTLLQLAAQELERRRVRIETLEARLRASEDRAAMAEARAAEAQARLQQVHDELAKQFPASMRLLDSPSSDT